VQETEEVDQKQRSEQRKDVWQNRRAAERPPDNAEVPPVGEEEERLGPVADANAVLGDSAYDDLFGELIGRDNAQDRDAYPDDLTFAQR
jgi:hypothetical protein